MQLVLNIPSREMRESEHREISKEVEDALPIVTRLGAQLIGSESLAELLQSGNLEKTLIIDSRSFVEYNSSHILRSKNVVCSKLVKRRLLQNKMTIQELLENSCKLGDIDSSCEVIVYDQNIQDVSSLSSDDFLAVLLSKLCEIFKSVFVLEGDKPNIRSVAFMIVDRTCEWITNQGSIVLSVTDLCRSCHVQRKHHLLTMREKTKKRFNAAGLSGPMAGIKPKEFKCRKISSSGGFEAFQSCFPYLCETQDKSKCPTITQLSQPCLPITSIGPTKVLSHLYLGSQQDVLDENLLQQNGINYVLNISKTCPAPSYIPANHFLRIPVKDNYGETILSWLDDAIQFIDKVKSANGKVIVHCLAGISRSPTVAIAYIMKRLNMTNETAYRFVKSKRPTISPNFNFLGQLIEYEKLLQKPSLSESLQADCSLNVSLSSSCQLTHKSQAENGTEIREETESSSDMETVSSSPENSKQENSRKIAQPRSRSKSPMPPSQGKSLPKVTLSDLSSSTSGTSKSCKRSISEKDSAKFSSPGVLNLDSSSANISQSGGRSVPRPAGLSLKVVSHHEPVFLASPERTDSKKPRSGSNTPVGLGVLEWGTSNLSMNSPKAGSGNPFVDACERFQAHSRMKVEEKLLLSPTREKDEAFVSEHSATSKKGTLVEYSTNQGNVQHTTNHAKEKQKSSPGKSILKKSTKLDLNSQSGSNIPNQDQNDSSSPGSSKSASKVQKGVLRSLPQHLKLRIKVSPSRQESSSSSPPLGQLSATCVPLVRQGSGQSLCSESSASSGISPNLESDTSSLLDRHSSISSGISPDYPSSVLDSSGSPSKAPLAYSSSLQKGWNPFRFPSRQGDEDSPSEGAGETIWQKRPESSESLSSSSTNSPKLSHQSPVTAMDRGMTYFTRCKFDPDERRDSWDCMLSAPHQKKCNSDRNTKVLSVRSQSCEEISSCAREAVVSEMVRSSRENLFQYGLTRFDDDEFETCSLSSERSLSSSCEMIEVS